MSVETTSTNSITPQTTEYPQRIVLLFVDSEQVDEVILIPSGAAFRWIYAASPDVTASDSFPSEASAWAWAWRTWAKQIQIAENFPANY